MKAERNPKLYRELCKPFATHAEAQAAVEAFEADLAAIRTKHRIPDVYCVIQFGRLDEEGEEVQSLLTLHYGDSLKAVQLTAYAYGMERANHEEMMGRILKNTRPDKGR